MRAATLLLALVVVGGCAAVDRESYPETAASTWCRKKLSCDKGDFEATWTDHADCVAEMSTMVEDLLDLAEFIDITDRCTFDEGLARESLAELRGASCESFVDNSWNDGVELYVCE